MAHDPSALDAVLAELIGKQLAFVTFVHDYWQLGFDGPFISVFTDVHVKGAGWACKAGEAGFRDRLCERIGQIVVGAVALPEQYIDIEFSDRSKLRLSFRDADYRGPEALNFSGFGDGTLMVL